jgi:uncharacterized membrane protein
MQLIQSIAPFTLTTLSALALDFVWLTYRQSYHNKLFESIQKSPLQLRILPAIVVYTMIPIATFFYASKEAKSGFEAFSRGALVGFFLYGFYDATNYATLTNWTLQMAISDTLWGTFLCAIVAVIGYYAIKKF